MADRSKVGRGNRKIVRDLFRKAGIEFPYGRDCVNGRYSFKIEPIHSLNINARLTRAKVLLNILKASLSLNDAQRDQLDLEIVPTNNMCGYPYGVQYGVAVRFRDA